MSDPTVRALTLLGLLEARAVWSGRELAERLGVTTRTVRRDVDRLRELGYPVGGEQGADGGYRLGRGGQLPPLMLDDGEAVAVAVGLRQAAAGAVTGIEEDALRALTKLEQVLPRRLLPVVRTIDASTATLDLTGVPRADAEVLASLARAVADRVWVRFAYRKASGGLGEREVEPVRLLTTGRLWYLFAFDRGRVDWRTFRLDRIAELHVTTFRFAVRPDAPDPAERIREAFGGRDWPVSATVRLTAPVSAVARRLPRQYGTARALDAESCEVVAGAHDLPALARHLALVALDVGAELEVVDPPALADELRAVATRIAGFAGA